MRAQAPTHRPTWVLILSSMMLLSGGLSLITGVWVLRDPGVLALDAAEAVGTPAELVVNRELAAARTAAVAAHHASVHAGLVAQIVLALFTLYATAAVLARDRHGRALTLGVGTLAIVYRLGTIPVYLSLMNDYVARAAGPLARAAALHAAAGAPAPSLAELTGRLHTEIIRDLVFVTAIGIIGSLVLLRFFGGPRGRALYGLDGRSSPKPAA